MTAVAGLRVELAFTAAPFNEAGLVWTDVTAFVRNQVHWRRGRNYDNGRTEAGVATVVLDNRDGRFTPENGFSPYTPFVTPRTPVRISAVVGGVATGLWRGYVERWPQEFTDSGAYSLVKITAVDGFKSVLGQTFGVPYETVVQTDYGILSSALGEYYAFDEAAPPFADIQPSRSGATTLTAKGTTANIASIVGAQRTGARFTGTAGVLWTAGSLTDLECWFKIGSLPDTTQLAYGGASVIAGTNTPGNTSSPMILRYEQSSGGGIGGVFYQAPKVPDLFSSGWAAWLHRPVANQMLNDNQASFVTDLTEWTASNVTGGIFRTASGGSSLPTRQFYDAWACQIVNGAANWSLTTANFIPVTPSTQYGLAYTFTNPLASTLTVASEIDWYTSGNVFISTSTRSIVTQNGFNDGIGVNATAPSNAAKCKLRVAGNASFSGSCYVDGFMLIGGTNAPPPGDPFWTAQFVSARNVGVPYYVPPSLGNNTTSPVGIDLYISRSGYLLRIPLTAAFFGAWHLLTLGGTAGGTPGPTNSVVRMDKTDYSGNSVYLVGSTSTVIAQGTGTSVTFGHPGTTAGQYACHDLSLDEVFISASSLTAVNAAAHDKHYDLIMQGTGVFRPLSFGAQDTGGRVSAVLDTVGWPAGLRVIDVGSSVLQSTGSVAGQTALNLMQLAAAAELGNIFLDGQGRFVFQGRRRRYSPPYSVSQATYGEAEIPYLPDIVVEYDDTFIYNDVAISQTGSTYVSEALDVASQGQYGLTSFTATYPLANTADVDGTAKTLLARYKQPHRRIEKVTLDVYATPGVANEITAREIGDLVTVKRRPIGAPPQTIVCVVEGVEGSVQWDVSGASWHMTYLLDPEPVAGWVLGDPVASILGSSTVTNY